MQTGKIFLSVIVAGALIVSCKTTKNTQTTTAQTSHITAYTYTQNIKAIIDPGCGTKCHRAEKHAGGINLSTFEGVKEAALHGKLIAAINHEKGAKMMPPNGVKMDSAFIEMIDDWAKGGAPQ